MKVEIRGFESIMYFFKLLDDTIDKAGTIKSDDYNMTGIVVSMGDKDTLAMRINYYCEDMKIPPIELTQSDIEKLKQDYINYTFSKYTCPKVLTIVKDTKLEFRFE
jgi:hypothetical protein